MTATAANTVPDDLALVWIDQTLRLVQAVRDTRPRDFARAFEDALLDLRTKVEP